MDHITLQSAGTAAVALYAAILAVFQLIFAFKKPRLTWYIWGAAVSFSGMIYAVGVFLEYNMPAGGLNHFGGMLEFTAHIFLVHSIYGLSFDYLNLSGKKYHLAAGVFHLVLLALLWGTSLIVSDQFVSRNFSGLAGPFVEAGLGPLGPFFILYIVGAATVAAILWLIHRPPDPRYKKVFLSGMIFWLALGVHDALAAMGFRSVQYLMEYGFLGFSIAVLWVIFDSYKDKMAQDQYRVITDFANDAILVLQDQKCVFSNPACDAVFGFPVSDLKSDQLFARVADEDRPGILRYYANVQQANGAGETFVFRINRPGGVVHLEIRGNRIIYRNRPAVLTIARDISLRIRKEAALKEQEEKLQRLKKMESLGLLAGGVAHDLNNVLSGIVSYPELLLLDLPEDSKLRKPLETIQDSGVRASTIVQDLLTVARGVAVPKEPVNFNTIIRAYLTSPEYKKLLHFHSTVKVEDRLDDSLQNIKGSTAHLRKVVMNLVSNAAEAIDASGTVLVETANRHMDQSEKGHEHFKTGEYVVLSVSDSGPGISEEDLDRIFEPFYTKKVLGRSGTGLGLSVAWNIVQEHEGVIDVTSSGQGTRFDVYIPVTREAVIGRKKSQALASLKGEGQTVLVVDDVKSQCEITCMMLDALGYRADAVESGEAAVRYVKDHPVDLMILDMVLDKGMNGRDTYEQILKISPRQKAVIVSGFAQTELVTQTLEMGAGRYLKKPLILEELGQALKDVLK